MDNILAKILGQHISAASKQLPDAATAPDRVHVAAPFTYAGSVAAPWIAAHDYRAAGMPHDKITMKAKV